MAQCEKVKPDGTRCNANSGDDTFCYFHRSNEAERKSASAQGGHNRANSERAYAALPDSLKYALTKTMLAIQRVGDNSMTPAAGRTIAALASVIVSLHESGLASEKIDQLEKLLKDDE